MAELDNQPLPQGNQEASTSQPSSTPAEKQVPITDPDILHNKEIGGLAYIPFVCLFIFLFRKDSPFVQQNAKQGVALFLFVIFGWVLAAIPLIKVIGFIILIAALIFIVQGFFQAFMNGKIIVIPFLTNYIKNSKVEKTTQKVQNAVSTAVDTAMNTPVVNEEKMEQEQQESAKN